MAASTEVHCSRCGAAGHLAVSCPKKSFMRPLCVQCNRLGHLKANCPQLRECNYCHGLGHVARDCPKKPVARSSSPSEVKGKGEGKAKGQGKGSGRARAEKEDPPTPVVQKCWFCGSMGHLEAKCPELQECYCCHGFGHLARDCPKKGVARSSPPSEVKGKGEGKATGQGQGSGISRGEKEDDQQSIQSNSTVATHTDHVSPTPVMQKCSFCGTDRGAAKYKRGHNACKDRCQQCFRSFKQ